MNSKPTPERAREILDDRPIGYLAAIRPDGPLGVNPPSVLYDGSHVQRSSVTDRANYRNTVADPRITVSIPQHVSM